MRHKNQKFFCQDCLDVPVDVKKVIVGTDRINLITQCPRCGVNLNIEIAVEERKTMTIQGLCEATNFVYRFVTKLALFVLALCFLAFCLRENDRRQKLEQQQLLDEQLLLETPHTLDEPDFNIKFL